VRKPPRRGPAFAARSIGSLSTWTPRSTSGIRFARPGPLARVPPALIPRTAGENLAAPRQRRPEYRSRRTCRRASRTSPGSTSATPIPGPGHQPAGPSRPSFRRRSARPERRQSGTRGVARPHDCATVTRVVFAGDPTACSQLRFVGFDVLQLAGEDVRPAGGASVTNCSTHRDGDAGEVLGVASFGSCRGSGDCDRCADGRVSP
jgi:hypothetical protein